MIYPMFAVVMLTVIVGCITIYHRWTSVTSGRVSIKYFRTMSGEAPLPETVAKTSRHFDNMFEVPTLFYAACLAAMITSKDGPTMMAFAWLFVFARVVHAFIHITYNNVLHRMLAFLLGIFAMFAMWITLVLV